MERNTADRSRLALLQPQWADALASMTRVAVDAGLCDYAGVSELMGDGTFRTIGATAPLVEEVNELQYRSGQRPCIDSTAQAGLLHSSDAGVDPRWPVWGPDARRRGIGGLVSVALAAAERSLGALNLYRRGASGYTAEDLDTAERIGAHASIALFHLRDAEHLWKAIDARHMVGQAQGILMERFNISAEAAFSLLRRLSQEGHVKLRLIAEQVIQTRTLPPSSAGTPSPPTAHDRRSSDVLLPRAN